MSAAQLQSLSSKLETAVKVLCLQVQHVFSSGTKAIPNTPLRYFHLCQTQCPFCSHSEKPAANLLQCTSADGWTELSQDPFCMHVHGQSSVECKQAVAMCRSSSSQAYSVPVPHWSASAVPMTSSTLQNGHPPPWPCFRDFQTSIFNNLGHESNENLLCVSVCFIPFLSIGPCGAHWVRVPFKALCNSHTTFDLNWIRTCRKF